MRRTIDKLLQKIVTFIFRLFWINLVVIEGERGAKGLFMITSAKWANDLNHRINIVCESGNFEDKSKAFWYLVKQTLKHELPNVDNN